MSAKPTCGRAPAERAASTAAPTKPPLVGASADRAASAAPEQITRDTTADPFDGNLSESARAAAPRTIHACQGRQPSRPTTRRASVPALSRRRAQTRLFVPHESYASPTFVLRESYACPTTVSGRVIRLAYACHTFVIRLSDACQTGSGTPPARQNRAAGPAIAHRIFPPGTAPFDHDRLQDNPQIARERHIRRVAIAMLRSPDRQPATAKGKALHTRRVPPKPPPGSPGRRRVTPPRQCPHLPVQRSTTVIVFKRIERSPRNESPSP